MVDGGVAGTARPYPRHVVDGQRVVSFEVDGDQVEVPDDGSTLLGVLRYKLGRTGPKAGCSPQGQCGCCTVLVDGEARIACVTPIRRVNNKTVITIDGLDPDRSASWGEAFCATGGTQCGYCTPGIILRLESLKAQGVEPKDGDTVRKALQAHLCRCTGWQTIVEAWEAFGRVSPQDRDRTAAARRAEIEGGTPQQVHPGIALGRGGFSSDTAPEGSLVAVRDGAGTWHVANSLPAARTAAGKTQGRRTTIDHSWPLEIPPGDWDITLRTTWVEPAALETDAAWCEPGGEPSSIIGNGGAFGSKSDSPVIEASRELATQHGRTVLAVGTREDTVLWGAKRPPVAIGLNADGTGTVRVVACDGIEAAIRSVAPLVNIELVNIDRPAVSASLRAAGWAEVTVALVGLQAKLNHAAHDADPHASASSGRIVSPQGATAEATIEDGRIKVKVRCGQPLDEIVLRSYCIGAAHMAWSWLTSEALTVDSDGVAQDLTIRSFGIVKAADMPEVEVDIDITDDRVPMNGSDVVFIAVAAAGWQASGYRQDWPVGPIVLSKS